MRYGRTVRLLVGTIVLFARTDGLALAPSESRCVAAKARAAARVVRRMAACHAKNVLAGGTAGPACFAEAAKHLPEALERADAIGPCGGNHAHLAEIAQTSCLLVPDVFDRCNATKIRAAGDLAAGLLHCLGRAGGAVDADCFAGRHDRFLAEFARAERRGPCPGTPERFAEIVDACIGRFAVALGCGNGRIDRGEQCDGQIFCTVRECRIRSEIACCQLGTPPTAVCADVFPEMCFAGGFQTAPGFCAGEPAPAICGGCKLGGCADPPIASTTVCCERSAGCDATTVASAVALATALQQCVADGGQPFLGACEPDGHCLP